MLAPQMSFTQTLEPGPPPASGGEKVGHRLPSQAPCTTHFNNDAETGLTPAKVAEGDQLRPRQNLTFQQQQSDRRLTIEEITQLGHDLLHLSNGSSTTHALMTQVGRTDSVFLRQKDFWIAEATR